jgi:hypothetical protein
VGGESGGGRWGSLVVMLLSELTSASLLRDGVFLTLTSLQEADKLLDRGLGGLYSVYSHICRTDGALFYCLANT